MPSVINGNDNFSTADNSIEHGEDAVAKWIKFPDGTMLMYNYVGVGEVNGINKVFPVPFVDSVIVTATLFGSVYEAASIYTTSGLTDFNIRKYTSAGVASTSAYTWQAIGRWK